MDKKNNNLVKGSIVLSLSKLAIPIMATSFLQMAYSMTDMFWVGKLGPKSLASVGTVGFYTWLAMGIVFIPKIGAEIGVAQSVGKKDYEKVDKYTYSSLQISIILGFAYFMILILFKEILIGFFNISDFTVIKDGQIYMSIIAIGMISFFINPVLSAIYNGHGNSKVPFIFNTIGLIFNMILDPVLIFGYGNIKALGISGAAIATVISQFIVSFLFIYFGIKENIILKKKHFTIKTNYSYIKKILKLGIPASVQSVLFTVFAMLIARIVGNWGATAIAVQRVGSQIEALSWMTASGFATAISTFVGQNYGAKEYSRVKKGCLVGILIISVIGILSNVLFLIYPKPIFSIFSKDKYMIEDGIRYLQIISYSQLFMCIEIATSGAFNGLGKTIPPSIVGITFNAMRIPLAIYLSSNTNMGLDGVWWTLSTTSILKGLVLFTWLIFILKDLKINEINLLKEKI